MICIVFEYMIYKIVRFAYLSSIKDLSIDFGPVLGCNFSNLWSGAKHALLLFTAYVCGSVILSIDAYKIKISVNSENIKEAFHVSWRIKLSCKIEFFM